MTILSPSRQSRLSATIETPSATLPAKPMEAMSVFHVPQPRDPGAGAGDLFLLRDTARHAEGFVAQVTEHRRVVAAEAGGLAARADVSHAFGKTEVPGVEQGCLAHGMIRHR